ncbi:ABC transporter permease subunit [Nocardia brasiliensis]|uniref:ABC transporter permease subunit n=1 Tax=Nocardia brasiliensis TaxID=37326 RepID=UPI00245752B2|nr:ABC transporter permease subunit [Nocardia brasiliensis]
MLRTVYTKSLRDQRRGLLGWSIGVVLLVLLESAIWPTFSDMSGMQDFLNNYPEAMRKLFNLEEFTTGTGFLNAELFSMLLPILFMVFAIGRGARGIAGEEERGTLEVLLVNGVSPIRLTLEQAAVVVTAVAVLGSVLFGSLVVCSAVFGLGVTVSAAASGVLSMTLLGIEFGLLAVAIGAATGRRVFALAVASVLAVAAYVLYVASKLVAAVQPWGPWSPFHQAVADGPMGAGLPLSYLWLAAAGICCVLAALPIFDRRDIAGS